jgi:hypothetical protein
VKEIPMSDETTTTAPETKESEELIMCYVSKKMVPMSETVEVTYGANKKYRVLPKYIQYHQD